MLENRIVQWVLIIIVVFSSYFTQVIAQDTDQANLPTGRAMWLWNIDSSNNIINDLGTARDELFAFCRSPHGNPDNKISVLFFGSADALYSNQDNLRNFLREASDNGIYVEYLDGNPSWATYNHKAGFDRINKIIEFNSSALSEKEKFKGIQFDVEPYLLLAGSRFQPPYWDTNLDTVWKLFVSYVDSCQKLIDRTNLDLYFGIAIPRWYENRVGNDELRHLQSIVDYCAIMDYNENSSVIIRDAENEINNASALNKRVWIGVETKEISPETVSFHEEGILYMESVLKDVLSVYGANPAFSGIAIHAYNYYKSTSLNPKD